MFLVDTNVLLDIFTDDPRWRPWSERAVGDARRYRSYFPSVRLVAPQATA